MNYKLADKAVLMRLSFSLPGEARTDKDLTKVVKKENGLGDKAGKWLKTLYPPEALGPIKQLDGEIRAYHDRVTLPWDRGTGILPAGLIIEYGDTMRINASRRQKLVDDFLRNIGQWVAWAMQNHNGTFDASEYPPLLNAVNGQYYDTTELATKFDFRTEPIPVPGSEHFSETLASLLGTDVESVNCRVFEATKQAGQELMKRLIAPVKAMAQKLAEAPKEGKEDIVFRDTLVGNVQEIVELAPKLNLSGDPVIDQFVKEIQSKLANLLPQKLREHKGVRQTAAENAAELLKRLEAYKI